MNQFLTEFSEKETEKFYYELNPGQRVQLIRQTLNSFAENDYSLTKVAKQIDTHVSTLSRFENQNTNLKLTTFMNLAKYLNFSLDLVLKGRLVYKNDKFESKIKQKLKNLTNYNQRIKYLQQEFNLNTAELKNSPVTISTFNKVINKKVVPKIRTIILIAEIFEINIDLLIHGYYPTNQLPALKEYKQNLKNLIEEFPTQVSVLKEILNQVDSQNNLKEKLNQIINSLIEMLKLFPQQLKLKKLLIHNFQTKLDKIKKIYYPLDSIIDSLNNIIKNLSTTTKVNPEIFNLLAEVENKLRETKLTLDGLNFHQQNKPSESEKSLTIFTTIAQPLNQASEKLNKFEKELKSNSSSETDLKADNSKTANDKIKLELPNNKINSTSHSEDVSNYNNNEPDQLCSQLNIETIKSQTNFQHTPNLKELYQRTNQQLSELKSQLQKYISNTSTKSTKNTLQEYWQLYDLLQLELESFWNKKIILKQTPKETKSKFKIFILNLINLLNPLNRLLKVLNGEVIHRNYYIDYLFKMLEQELINLPNIPNLLSTDLLQQIENRTRQFLAAI